MAAERAPEPTMDEILASIKRIIADEDRGSRETETRHADSSRSQFSTDAYSDPFSSGTGRHPFSSSASMGTGHEQGDEQLIADIARALNNPADPSDAGDDDILDLTRIMTDETASAASPDGDPASAFEDDAFELGSPLRDDTPAATAPAEADPIAADAVFEEDDSFALDTPAIDTPMGEPQADPAGDLAANEITEAFSALDEQPEAKPEDAPSEAFQRDDPWALKSAVEEDAEVLDFGRKEPVFTEAFPAAEAPKPFFWAEQDGEAADDISDQVEAPADNVEEAKPDDSVVIFPTPEIEPEPEAAPAAAEELEDISPAEEVPDVIAMPPIAEASALPAEPAEADVAVSGGQKSLEDSVKEMLRPMLRSWLDENMPRILESALRDELQGRLPG